MTAYQLLHRMWYILQSFKEWNREYGLFRFGDLNWDVKLMLIIAIHLHIYKPGVSLVC